MAWESLFWNFSAATNFALPIQNRDATIVGFHTFAAGTAAAVISTRNDTYANLVATSSQPKPEILSFTVCGIGQGGEPTAKNIKWYKGVSLYLATSAITSVMIYFQFDDDASITFSAHVAK